MIKPWLWLLASLSMLLGACVSTPKPVPIAQDEISAAPEAMPAAASLHPVKVAKSPRKPAKPAVVEEDVWARFAQGRHWQPCKTDPGIDRWISRYAGSPQRFATTLTPLVPLIDYVLTRSTALNLPSETMVIPIVESYYRPDARGPGGALGLWQLMPDTGSRFGLLRRAGHDDRLDVRGSTDAALRLLVLNSEAFSGNPKLMFAAYNAGAYRLRKALGAREHSSMTSLDGLGLSRTTQDYLDKVKALGCLLGEPKRFGLELPPLAVDQRLIEFKPPFSVDPKDVAARAGVPVATLKSWNAIAFARGRAGPELPLLIPRASEAVLLAALESGNLKQGVGVVPPAASPAIPAAAASSKAARTHRVASGDSLWEIAKRYRVRVADLMRWNKLNKRSVLRIGQRLYLEPH